MREPVRIVEEAGRPVAQIAGDVGHAQGWADQVRAGREGPLRDNTARTGGPQGAGTAESALAASLRPPPLTNT